MDTNVHLVQGLRINKHVLYEVYPNTNSIGNIKPVVGSNHFAFHKFLSIARVND